MTKSTLFIVGCLAVTVGAPLIAQSTDTAIVTTALPVTAPQQHLEDARLVLTSVSETSLPIVDRKRWSALQKDFAVLVSSYGDVPTHPSAWRLAFSDVERDLAWVSETGGSFTEGRAPSSAPTPKVDTMESSTRVTLRTFRRDVELFYDAATTTPAHDIVAPSAALSGP